MERSNRVYENKLRYQKRFIGQNDDNSIENCMEIAPWMDLFFVSKTVDCFITFKILLWTPLEHLTIIHLQNTSCHAEIEIWFKTPNTENTEHRRANFAVFWSSLNPVNEKSGKFAVIKRTTWRVETT